MYAYTYAFHQQNTSVYKPTSKTYNVCRGGEALRTYLNEVEFADPKLCACRAGDVQDVMAVGGDNVAVAEVCGYGSLLGDAVGLFC